MQLIELTIVSRRGVPVNQVELVDIDDVAGPILEDASGSKFTLREGKRGPFPYSPTGTFLTEYVVAETPAEIRDLTDNLFLVNVTSVKGRGITGLMAFNEKFVAGTVKPNGAGAIFFYQEDSDPDLVGYTCVESIANILDQTKLKAIKVVDNYDALPPAADASGEFYWASNSQGVKFIGVLWGGDYYPVGTYYSNGVTWEYMDTPAQATQAEVDAGVVTNKFVTPVTLKNWGATININGKIATIGSNPEFRVAQASTGALTYGGITIASATTVNIGAVDGYVMNNESNPNSPTFTKITYPGELGKTVTTIGSGIITYVLLQPDGFGGGTIVFQNTFPTSAQRKAMIYLSKVSHPNSISLAFAADEVDFMTSPISQFRDLFQTFNYVNQGVKPSPNGANLNFNTSAGIVTGNGINFVTDNTNPNSFSVVAQTPTSFIYRNQNGGTSGFVTLIDPTMYDNGGVTTAVGGGINSSTIQYIYYVPPLGFIVQRGQFVYGSLASAISNIGKESFVQWPNLTRNSILVGVLCATRTATQLNDSTKAQFFSADILGGVLGSAGGTTTGTLQTSYNNATDPEIVTNSTLGAVTVRRGSAADTDTIIEGQNGAGTTTFSVNGNGDVVSPTTNRIQSGTDKYAVATGTDTYLATLTPAPTAYAAGNVYWIKIPNTNTVTTPTLNINSLGAKTIKGVNGIAVPVGYLIANGNYAFLYDGTDFIIQAGLLRVAINSPTPGSSAVSSPADSTTVYVGQSTTLAPNAAANLRQFELPTGVLRLASLGVDPTGAVGSSEAVTVNLRNITDSVSSFIGTITYDARGNGSFVSGLAIVTDSSKMYSLEYVYPPFATNPTNVLTYNELFIYAT